MAAIPQLMQLLLLILAGLCKVTASAAAGRRCSLTTSHSDICGMRGRSTVSPLEFYSNQTVSSVVQCANLAFYSASYSSIAYNETSNLCVMIEHHVVERGKTLVHHDLKSDVIIYDVSCFLCPLTCPQPTDGSNVLGNGGFEASSKYIGPWAQFMLPRTYPITKKGHHSQQSLYLSLPQRDHPPFYDGFIQQQPRLCTDQDQMYYLTLDYKYARPLGVPPIRKHPFKGLSLTAGNMEVSVRFPEPPGANGSWTSLKYSLTALEYVGDGTIGLVDIEFVGGALDTFYLDNVALTAIPKNAGLPATKGPNALANGGFESGALSPWIAVTGNGAARPRIIRASTMYGPGFPGNKYALAAPLKHNFPYLKIKQFVSGLVTHVPYLISFEYRMNFIPRAGRVDIYLFANGNQYTGDFFTVLSGFVNDTVTTGSWVYTPTVKSMNFTFVFGGAGYSALAVDKFSVRQLA